MIEYIKINGIGVKTYNFTVGQFHLFDEWKSTDRKFVW